MADWADISRSAKKHGDFAGRTKSEQDAYFEFFAGPESSRLPAVGLRLFMVFARVIQVHIIRGLRLPIAGVAYTDPAMKK
ncbi:MAG: hypothetical protein NXI02_00925 [Rhodobacteraceae bacterium]|nr:hypothetical protein [Paracoccaceae bacterium]